MLLKGMLGRFSGVLGGCFGVARDLLVVAVMLLGDASWCQEVMGCC